MVKKTIKLYIDTRDNKKNIVKIEKNGKVFLVQSINMKPGSEQILSLIKKALKKARISLKDLDGIFVEKGPGSFTGLRVGISIGNALSFCLDRKINNNELSFLETPNY